MARRFVDGRRCIASQMKVCLVGGAVRDTLLGRASGDRDWVVTDCLHEQMLERGFSQVGQSFPVYIHPVTGEEYALARQERKVAIGHTGFTFHTKKVTLEQDLQRRDLTINALALANDGTIIDPCGGYRDLQARLLRHIAPAFSEDPLRVLRVARFAAQLASFGFRIAPETLALMREMTASGELESLPAERILQETHKALASDTPSRYFLLLREIGALVQLYPEIDALFTVPQTAKYHPEVDTGIHAMMVIDQSALLHLGADARFAAMCHDYGKALTPRNEWPSHKRHEERGVPVVRKFCQRIKAAKSTERLAVLVCRYHLLAHQAFILRPTTITTLFYNLDGWRRPETVRQYALVCAADSRGRTGHEQSHFRQADFLLQVFAAVHRQVLAIDTSKNGKEIERDIFQQRCQLVRDAIQQWHQQHNHIDKETR